MEAALAGDDLDQTEVTEADDEREVERVRAGAARAAAGRGDAVRRGADADDDGDDDLDDLDAMDADEARIWAEQAGQQSDQRAARQRDPEY